VGEEVSGILQRAHETAAQITAQSRSEAEDRLAAARQEAADIVSGAADRVKDLDLEADRIWEERLRIVEDARELARQLLTLADTAAQQFPAEETASTERVAEPGIAEIFETAAREGMGQQSVEQSAEAEGAEASEGVIEGQEVPPLGERSEDAPDTHDREATAVMPPVEPPEQGEQPQ
jgi:vacuolar-type H+-ATPase subunit H